MAPIPPHNKRVTKAGRDAHAIYLPKAWIDSWSPEQRTRSEVSVMSLDEHLVLSPVADAEPPAAALRTNRPDDLLRLLLSAYVSGHRAFTVHRDGDFTDTQLMEARRFLRLLDERLDVEWDSRRIRFARDPRDNPRSTVAEHLFDLSGKVLEMAESISELLEFFPHNPRRVLHAVSLVAHIERDDVQRMKNQAYRAVSRLHVPAERIADLQLLMLATQAYARMGKLLVETACTVGDRLGVPRARLHYPAELLERDLRTLPPAGAVFRAFLDQASRDLGEYITLLRDLKGLTATAMHDSGVHFDGAAALELSRRAQDAHDRVSGHLVDRVGRAWGPQLVEEDAGSIYGVVKVHVHVQDLLQEIRTLADRIADFRLAESLGSPT